MELIQDLDVTLTYVPLLALLFAGLALAVVIQRRKHDVPFGDGGIPTLRGAIRAHGNFAEYVPFVIIIIALLELAGTARWIVSGLFVVLIAARLSHAVAMFLRPKTAAYFVTRIFGALATWLIILIGALLLLTR